MKTVLGAAINKISRVDMSGGALGDRDGLALEIKVFGN
jgi:hypothetical protein